MHLVSAQFISTIADSGLKSSATDADKKEEDKAVRTGPFSTLSLFGHRF